MSVGKGKKEKNGFFVCGF